MAIAATYLVSLRIDGPDADAIQATLNQLADLINHSENVRWLDDKFEASWLEPDEEEAP